MRTLIFLTFIVLLLPGTGKGQPKEVRAEVNISEVTVYTNGARIFSAKEIEVPAGTSLIRLVNISPELDPGSIQVSAKGPVTIVSVNHEQDFLAGREKLPVVAELEKNRKTLEQKMANHRALLDVLDKEMQFLTANMKITGTATTTKVSDLQAANDFFRNKTLEITNERNWRNDSVASLARQVEKISNQIREAQTNQNRPVGVISVTVDAREKAKAFFMVNYLVKNASWFPTYDLRVNNITDPVQLTYKANVSQNSGLDWTNVKIRFSSANPNQSGILPVLQPWRLNFQTFRQTVSPGTRQVSGMVFDATDNRPLPGVSIMVEGTSVGTISDMGGRYSIPIPSGGQYLVFSFIGMNTERIYISGPEHNVYLQPSAQNLEESVVVGYGATRRMLLERSAKSADMALPAPLTSIPLEVSLNERQTTVEFELEKPFTVPSNGKNFLVDVATVAIPSEYTYIAIPKLDPAAHLRARLTGWEQYNLLEGEANIYFEGAFTGKTLLDTRNFTDTLEISLGVDRNITVQRTPDKDFSSTRFLSARTEASKSWKLAVRNNKQQKISLLLIDQVPLTASSEIEIVSTSIDGGMLNAETGEVRWQVTLDPSGRSEKKLSYTVRYPKGKKVVLE